MSLGLVDALLERDGQTLAAALGALRDARARADAYERGAAGITAGRRERKVVPVVDESMEELDHTFDALVVEALRPLRPDSASVASLRALIDLEVW